MSEAAKPSTTELVIQSLYTHVCEQQEILLMLSKSTSAMLAVFRETVNGFDANFKAQLAALDERGEFEAAQAHLDAMKQALQVISETLQVHPDGTPL
jgi:hypothetical protein